MAPDSVAVCAEDVSLSYADLAERAGHVAGCLRALGVGPGDLVGQCVRRSAALVVGALATVMTGAAYVAIDPAYPDERIRWMLEDADVAAVVTDGPDAPRALSRQPKVVLGHDGALVAEPPGDNGAAAPLPEGPRPEDLAYVVYTSGSTGRPKGVMVEHAALDNLVAWHRSAFALTAADRCTQIASPGFDAAVWEIWPALACGAAIHVVPEHLRRDPISLRDWLVRERITVSFQSTAVAETLIALPWPSDGAMRHLLTGGDALTRRPSPELPFTVVNNYGLSETAVVATSGPVAPAGSGLPSIGRAIDGVQAEVVDEQLQPVLPGEVGELLIGGVAVARGYLHPEDPTAERFLQDERGRWYRTGDRVRQRPGGEFEFLGRADDQLSLRGFRVEPAEVVNALVSHPAIASAAVLGRGASGADRELVAYVVAADGQPHPPDDELRDFLARPLPDYMVPAAYAWLSELPLTAHGKLDRDALQAPAPEATPSASPDIALETTIEGKIASVVAELLSVEGLGPHENFFLLGGHSMLGAQLIVRLEDLFGAEISLRYLFDHPTPAEIAEEVRRQTAADLVAG